MTWVYVLCRTEPLFTVGFYGPDGTWHTPGRESAVDL